MISVGLLMNFGDFREIGKVGVLMEILRSVSFVELYAL
jgi:hypothetical protein